MQQHRAHVRTRIKLRHAPTPLARSGCPGRREYALFDPRVDLQSVRLGVRLEQLRVELAEHIPDSRRFVAELHAEEGFEQGEQVRGNLGLEV